MVEREASRIRELALCVSPIYDVIEHTHAEAVVHMFMVVAMIMLMMNGDD